MSYFLMDRLTYDCRPMNLKGTAYLTSTKKHPVIHVVHHLVNMLQRLGYPFNEKERRDVKHAIHAIGTRGYLICPNCLTTARFMPINPGADLKAWFCNCSYDDCHQNGVKSRDNKPTFYYRKE